MALKDKSKGPFGFAHVPNSHNAVQSRNFVVWSSPRDQSPVLNIGSRVWRGAALMGKTFSFYLQNMAMPPLT
jgi:hypothetical protein